MALAAKMLRLGGVDVAPRSGRQAGVVVDDVRVAALDAELIGRATMVLGAGRNRVEETVEPAVGAVVHAKPGDPVRPGQPIVELHHRDHEKLGAALALVHRACVIADEPPPERPLVMEVIA